MAGRDPERDRDLDDWFAEPELESPRRRRRVDRATTEPWTPTDASPAGSDDWLARGDGARERFRGAQGISRNARLGLGAAVLAVLLLIGLAAGGVFSGGTHKGATPPTVPTTTPAATTTPSTPSTGTSIRIPAGTLKLGDKGKQVTILQRALKSLGYSPGTIDGKYGPATQRAVARFQRAAKLATDGILGPKTLAALAQAVSAKS